MNEAKPSAWMYEEYVWATGLSGYVWREKIEIEAPDSESQNVRNVTPLYARRTGLEENAEFETWRKEQIASLVRMGYPDAAKAFNDLGSVQWAGWQARAALEQK